MNRLDHLRAMRDRLDTEIAREEAYQKRIASLRGDWRESVSGGRDYWTQRIIATAVGYHGVTVDDAIGPSKKADVLEARQVACWLLRDAGRTYPEIGRHIGRDHTSVINAVKRVEGDVRLMDACRVIGNILNGEEVAS